MGNTLSSGVLLGIVFFVLCLCYALLELFFGLMKKGAASATGDYGAASATGKESIALAAGKDCKAKGALGCWIVLAERGEWDGNTYPIVSVKAFKVDGKSVKADTFYTLVNGEAVEASQD